MTNGGAVAVPWVLCAAAGHDAPLLVIAMLQSVKNSIVPDVPVQVPVLAAGTARTD